MWNFIGGIFLGCLLSPLIKVTIGVVSKIFNNAYTEYRKENK